MNECMCVNVQCECMRTSLCDPLCVEHFVFLSLSFVLCGAGVSVRLTVYLLLCLTWKSEHRACLDRSMISIWRDRRRNHGERGNEDAEDEHSEMKTKREEREGKKQTNDDQAIEMKRVS